MSPVGPLVAYCLLILLASLLGGWVPLLVRLTHRRIRFRYCCLGKRRRHCQHQGKGR